MVIYSAEEGKISERAHCFATFARVTPASDAAARRIELHHINGFSVRGHRLVMRCDTEAWVHPYEEHGEGLFDRVS